jgi:predicted  nucleic acid-binding Zn-ribbon protein
MSDIYSGDERRGEHRPSDLQYALQAIGERLKAIEEKFSLKVERVCEDMESLKDTDDKKHLDLERRIYQRVLNEFNKISNKLDAISTHNASVNLSIQRLDAKVDGLEKRLNDLEKAPAENAQKRWQGIIEKIVSWLIPVLLAGLLYWASKGFPFK